MLMLTLMGMLMLALVLMLPPRPWKRWGRCDRGKPRRAAGGGGLSMRRRSPH